MKKFLHKSRIYKEGISHKKDQLSPEGWYGIVSLRNGPVTINQIESARIALKRVLGKSVPLWIRIKPSKPVTHKSSGIRMGKGKGSIDHYIYYAQTDEVLFEIGAISYSKAKKAFEISNSKLPIPTILVEHE
jgi:large subunit ribosomal protein L16